MCPRVACLGLAGDRRITTAPRWALGLSVLFVGACSLGAGISLAPLANSRTFAPSRIRLPACVPRRSGESSILEYVFGICPPDKKNGNHGREQPGVGDERGGVQRKAWTETPWE